MKTNWTIAPKQKQATQILHKLALIIRSQKASSDMA